MTCSKYNQNNSVITQTIQYSLYKEKQRYFEREIKTDIEKNKQKLNKEEHSLFSIMQHQIYISSIFEIQFNKIFKYYFRNELQKFALKQNICKI